MKLEYFESKTTVAPVPRNQEVPKEAFGKLTGRSILVATSHAWFHQCHPDPEGVKLDILRKDFFPRLRKRFPHTEILVFDDWHSCPQWPRPTEEEQKRFTKCMNHMNSVYCYCDVVLFVQAPLPDLDERIYECELVPSEHEWLNFIDTIQYVFDTHPSMRPKKLPPSLAVARLAPSIVTARDSTVCQLVPACSRLPALCADLRGEG